MTLQHQLSDLETRVVVRRSPLLQVGPLPLPARLLTFLARSSATNQAGRLVSAAGLAAGGHARRQAMTVVNSPRAFPVKLTERYEARFDTGPTMKSSA